MYAAINKWPPSVCLLTKYEGVDDEITVRAVPCCINTIHTSWPPASLIQIHDGAMLILLIIGGFSVFYVYLWLYEFENADKRGRPVARIHMPKSRQ